MLGACLFVFGTLGPTSPAAAGVISEVALLLASDRAANDQLGTAVAVDGDVAIAGAPFDDARGAAYVFRSNGGVWDEEAKLTASDAATNDRFGVSVAVSGDVAVVGAELANIGAATDAGAAYVFRFNGANWVEEAKLTALDGTSGDQFGGSVSVDASAIVVGARFDDDSGSASGSAYVFRFDGAGWVQEQKLIASDGAANDLFGGSVAIDGDTAVAGAEGDDDNGSTSGSAYVFRFDSQSSAWVQEAKLLSSDVAGPALFGKQVAISGDAVLLGARDANGFGAAYVFRFDGASWLEEQKLVAGDPALVDRFGFSVGISGDSVVVGAALDDDPFNGDNAGSAYVFRYNGATWTQEQKIRASNIFSNDLFGFSSAISGGTVVVGATGQGSDRGAGYVFDVPPVAQITETAELLGSNSLPSELLGLSVSISGDTALLGAPRTSFAGSADLFRYDGISWVEEATLTASDGASGDDFGLSVAVSGDVAVVGARGHFENGFNTGSAYVFRYDGTAWVEEAKLLASDRGGGDNFGAAVSVVGDVVVVGAPNKEGVDRDEGAAYVYRYNGTTWVEEAKLVASDPGMDNFVGISVAVSGDTIVLGAIRGEGLVANSGAAYVFRYDGTVWAEEAKLAASDGEALEQFGAAVALSGDTAVITAPLDDTPASNAGSAYVFRYDGTAWVEEVKLTASDGAQGETFGQSVSVSGDSVVVGASAFASGSAYLYRYNASGWFEEAKLPASDALANDGFGRSVSISGDTVVVGAPLHDHSVFNAGAAYVYQIEKGGPFQLLGSGSTPGDSFGTAIGLAGDTAVVGALFDSENGNNAGAAYLFRYDGASWIEEVKLLASDGDMDEQFGSGVAIWGDTALIGAPAELDNGVRAGAAYVFRYDGTNWVEEAKLFASDGADFDIFGRTLAIFGDTAVIGARDDDDNGTSSGSAYVFRYNGTAWVEEAKLIASDAAATDLFGTSVAVFGDTVVIGAFQDDDGGVNSGSAYVFRYDGTDWGEEAKLTASDAAGLDGFGGSITVFGDTVVVGAGSHDHTAVDAGAVYVFRYNGTSWVEEVEITASDGVAGDVLGGSVSLHGDIAVVGATGRDESADNSGAAYVFRYDGAGWLEQQKLTLPGGQLEDRFGFQVAVSGGTALVGARDIQAVRTTAHLFPVFAAPASSCGDGALDAGEECDLGAANGNLSVCCSATCTFRSPAEVCNLAAGTCDLVELCTGQSDVCPADLVLPATTICSQAIDVCDVDETCDGISPACPADAFVALGTVCNAGSGDLCDPDEVCTGASASCPAEVLASAGTICDAGSGDLCDPDEVCSGIADAACPADAFAAAGTICNVGSGDLCDPSEVCAGAPGLACPADIVTPASTTCRAAAGTCDSAETCTGIPTATCPADIFAGAGQQCRNAAGLCDVPEVCSGQSASCPADVFAQGGLECRAAAGLCDAAEMCTGNSPTCSPDSFAPAGLLCRPSAGVCDVVEQCDGANPLCPADALEIAGLECRATAGVCDTAEACSGASALCPTDGFAAAGLECRAAVGGGCDAAEVCGGTAPTCPADVLLVAGTECRAPAGLCDAAESCTGSNATCPVDGLVASGVQCRSAAGACDAHEVCSGTDLDCPADQLAAAGTVCRAVSGACDVAEVCSGLDAACGGDAVAAAGLSCRPAVGVCDLSEVCTGGDPSCPVDTLVADQTVCDDGDICTAADQCLAGVCGGNVCLTSSVCNTNQIDIDFADLEAGCFFIKTAPLTSQYAAQGVTFLQGAGGVLHECSGLSAPAGSAPTYIGYSDGDQFETGAPTGTLETMALACPAEEVRFVIADASGAPSTFEAIATDGQGQEVDRVNVSLPTPFAEIVLSGPDIQSIDYQRLDAGTFVLDDVRLIPEPTTFSLAVWAMAAVAALRLAGIRRRA